MEKKINFLIVGIIVLVILALTLAFILGRKKSENIAEPISKSSIPEQKQPSPIEFPTLKQEAFTQQPMLLPKDEADEVDDLNDIPFEELEKAQASIKAPSESQTPSEPKEEKILNTQPSIEKLKELKQKGAVVF